MATKPQKYKPHRTHDMRYEEIDKKKCIDCELTDEDAAVANECPEYWEKVARVNNESDEY